MHKWIYALTIIWLAGATSIFAQEDELELIDSVSRLQTELDSDLVADRDKAEAELLKLGPQILAYLAPASDESTTDFKQRLTRIRTTLEKASVAAVTQPGKVRLVGEMTIGDVLKKILKQTRNEIAVADDSLLDKKIDINLQGVEFWPAMDEILDKSKLRIDRYGSQKPGQLMLTSADPQKVAPKIPTVSSKIFQTQVIRVDSSVNLKQPNLDFTTINLLVRWEPRLRPISVDIPMSNVKIIDEYGDAITLANQNEVIYGMVQPEIPEVEFSIQLPRLDRQVESIKSFKATVDAVLPGRSELFRFKNVAKLKAGFKQEKAGANVTFGGMRKNEDAYSIRLSLSFDDENNALESHQAWVFQNEVYLLDSQGQREDAISIETMQQDNEKVTVQYYFVEDPGNRTLIYKTPAAIVKLPVAIELNEIPLP